MNKRIIYAVIVVMSVAIAVLFGLQGYWIKNAISIREVNFSRNVAEAMGNVIIKLEKLEVADRIRTKMYKNKQGTNLFNMIDSLNQIFRQELDTSYGDSTKPENILKVTSEKINVVVLQEHTGEIIRTYDTSIITIQKRTDNNQIFSETPLSTFNYDSLMLKEVREMESKINRYLDKTSLVNDVFNDMFNMRHYDAMENRVNFAMLDSLISKELTDVGVNTDYELGVYSPLRNLMVIEKTGHYHKELLENGYPFNMFPRDLFMTPEYILIYFPKKDSYLLSQVWLTVFISTLLILTIMFSFVYTIYTIFKQKRLSEMKNDFINNMTHEFKTPITTIALACEALEDKEIERTAALQRSYINVINEENRRLGSMAEKILQTAIIDKGQLKLHYELLDIHNTVMDVINNIKIQAETKGGSISIKFSARNYYLKADRTHLTNVIYNVIDNAIKYTIETPQINVNTANIEDGILITISDNGMGISKTNQKRIFDKLFRISTGNVHDVKGFGLGLHYVKTIIEAHEGNVGVESEVKKGTRIKIYLPFESNHS